MNCNAPDQLLKVAFSPLAKTRKAKNTNLCIYKKEGVYFWTIQYTSYSLREMRVSVGIKLWMYDELLCSITHPDENVHFPDKLRWNGFFAMSRYEIKTTLYPYPRDHKILGTPPDELAKWCEKIFTESIAEIDGFIDLIESKYGDLNGFHIANAENDPLTAAFAYIAREEYHNAEMLLQIAAEKGSVFHRAFGSYKHDLRDVLLDYCDAKQTGKTWTREMVVGMKG